MTTATREVVYEGMSTPWGKAQEVRVIVEGVGSVHTAGHGGIKLDRKRNAQIPNYMRKPGGWYEEDCDWAIPHVVLADYICKDNDGLKQAAIETMKNWMPDEYARFTGGSVKPEESRALRKQRFFAEAKGKLIVTSAFGSWHGNVPSGKVGCIAHIDGDDSRHEGQLTGEQTYWLVDKDEYNKRSEFGFIIDPDRHEKCNAHFIPLSRV